MLIFILLCFFIVNISPITAERKFHKYVSTLINAQWKDTPLVLEAAEYLNDENPHYFWKFVDQVSVKSSEFHRALKPKDHYDLIMSITKEFLSDSEINLMKLGLSLRIYSAKVEMFHHIAVNKKISDVDCNNFIDIGSDVICNLEKLKEFMEKDIFIFPETYDIDHFYRGKKLVNKTLILYGQMGTNGFLEIHNHLKTLAENNKINYILRHYVKNRSEKKLRLSGYGVELQMKSTEYKATDDSDIKDTEKQSEENSDETDEIDGINFSVLKKLHPSKLQNLNKLYSYLLENSHEVGHFKVWHFQELSHQAAGRIINSLPSEAINVLTEISQNFPMQAKSLFKTKVSSDMKEEIRLNQDVFLANLNIQPSETALFINGLFFDIEVIDILTLLESLRSELRVMESFYKIGFSSETINKLLTLDLSNNMDSRDFAIDIRDSAIIWLNDIENDFQYNHWSPSLTELLRPTFPGMIRNVRRNLYNLVVILDPNSKSSISLVNLIESLFIHSAPLRIGFVFLTNFNMTISGSVDASVAVNNAYHYLMENKNPKDAIQFLSSLFNVIGPDGLKVDDVIRAIKRQDHKVNTDDIFGEESEYDIGRHLASDFIKRTGFKTFPQVLLNGVPLLSNQINADSFEETILSLIMSQTPIIQKAVYRGDITEGDDVVDFLMNQPNVMTRLNKLILKPEKNVWLNLVGSVPQDIDYTKWSSEDTSAWLMHNIFYLYAPRKIVTHHIYTVWLAIDLHLESDRKLLNEALDYLEINSDVRLSIIFNDDGKITPEKNINEIALAAFGTFTNELSFEYIRYLIKDEVFQMICNGKFLIKNDAVKNKLGNQKFMLGVHNYYCKQILDLHENNKIIIFNGRIIGPLDKHEEFTNEDFALLERYSQNTYGNKLYNFLLDNESSKKNYARNNLTTDDMIMKITSLLVPRPHNKNRFVIPFHSDKYSVVKVSASNPDSVAFNLIAIVDPVSRGAQKLGPILNVLQQSLNCNIKIFFNCVEKNSDMPLKSFYRFVLEPELQFTNNGDISGAIAKFTKLPTSSLLTQNIHAPENWLVEVVQSVYDLDNIKLDSVAVGVHSEYELEHLLLEGHCFETLIGNPPRGLQITLGTEIHPMIVDTIVMANLGYFQLKANPGEWILKLRRGRSAEIYSISSVEGSDIIYQNDSVKVLISSLKSNVIKLKVNKKLDKAGIDLLADDDNHSGIWNSISRTFTSSDINNDQEEKLNIFSLASGHLYERFIKIMMLSVLKYTKSPVKFWFLKNYLSPTLKDFLPHMAKEYRFEYELVQYKWPRWLHQQTEKQRTIWGYKILFLDVLFPLDVKKIIFVDADQVVRADLKELAVLDLGGAPYAYTPFCDSRKEMDGFRFWKQGYWKNHLQGRSYHISALYVVDLKRFRRIAAGDRLRGQYQALTQDPNSLSNLDQDLPNNMIHQVAIKTLPQEWLWCETWCDDKSKKYAKTIDLCNNPMTKEAKLQAAIRILPEWTSYDDEIKVLQITIENRNKQQENEEYESEIKLKHEEL